MANKNVDFESMASDIMFSKTSERKLIEKFGVEYRKGKGFSDLQHAIQKGLKNGMGKTEFELGMIEIYLKDVFKTKSVFPVDSHPKEKKINKMKKVD